jgi:hypothetical protein
MDWINWNALYGKPYAYLSTSGAVLGFCAPTALGLHVAGSGTNTTKCWDFTGSLITSLPSGFSAAMSAEYTSGWAGQPLVVGTQVFTPYFEQTSAMTSSNESLIGCFDYATGTTCANYPQTIPNSNSMYTLEMTSGDATQVPTPSNQVCLWMVADNGTGSISTFNPLGGSCPAIAGPAVTLTYHVNAPVGAPSSTGAVPSTVTGIATGTTENLAANPNNLSIPGYTFGGWSSTPSGTTPITTYGPMSSDGDVYAIWTPTTDTLTYHTNPPLGSSIPSGAVPSTVTAIASGTTETLAANPNSLGIFGYTFGGWSSTPDGTTPITTYGPMTANGDVYAIWTPVVGAPVANPQTHTKPVNVTYTGSLVVSGNSTGTYALVAQPSCGTATVSANGFYTLVPNHGFTGSCTFTYQLANNVGTAASTATVIFTSSGLAFTGFNGSGLLALMSGLLAAGACLTAIARRRRIN